MADNSSYLDNEISLNETIQSLWAYKIFIIVIVGIAIFLSSLHGSKQNKLYTATSLFKLDIGSKNIPMQIPKGMGNIASLTGLKGLGTNELDGLLESYFGREFIAQLDRDLDLRGDKYYNSYNPNSVDPKWKSMIKRLLGFSTQEIVDVEENIWRSIIRSYRKNVIIGTTEGFNIEIKVVHSDASRAAEVANGIMKKIILDSSEKAKTKRKDQLQYLANILANALVDVEKSQSNLKNFTIDNGTLPMEKLSVSIIQLDKQKESIETTKLLMSAVNKISNLFEKNEINNQSYLRLKKSHPIVNDVRFRRIFGQSEAISEWTWPDISSVLELQKTLKDRFTRLNIELNEIQLATEEYAKYAEKYAELTLQVNMAEATYTVMFEQVKSNSIAAGFINSGDEIYEYAAKPTIPSAPKRLTIIVIGTVIGFIIACVMTLIFSAGRGVYYSTKSLLFLNNANFTSRIKPFKISPKLTLDKINHIRRLSTITAVRNLILSIRYSNKEFVLISNIGSNLNARTLSRLLGVNIQDSKVNVAYIDFSDNLVKKNSEDNNHINVDFTINEQFENFDIISPREVTLPMNFLTKHNSREIVMNLKSKYDYIILGAENNDILSLIRFLEPHEVFHLALTSRKKTKRIFLEKISKILPLGAQLYD